MMNLSTNSRFKKKKKKLLLKKKQEKIEREKEGIA